MVVEGVLKVLGIVVGVLLSVAYLTVAERKFLSSIQRRRGPNVIGMYGLLQAFTDGVKLLLKEAMKPTSANSYVFVAGPIVAFSLALLGWCVIPMGEGIVYTDINIGVLLVLGVSGLGVYGVIMAGWSSNSKYAFLGGLRSTAQMISYEVSIGFTIVTVIVCSGSINITEIVLCQERCWYGVGLFPMWLVFLVSILAETNRHPFDLPEAEAELVSGYNVEYSGAGFVLFFLGEYSSMLLMSSMTVVLFLGGWKLGAGLKWEPLVFGFKVFVITWVFIWARGAFPRYRYDQLMEIGWKVLLPVSISWVIVSGSIVYGFEWLVL